MAGLGALAGIVSGVLPRVFGIVENWQDNKQERRMLELQLDAQKEVAAIRMDMSNQQGLDAVHIASFEHDTSAGRYKAKTGLGLLLMDLVGVWRAAMRPGIVSTLMALYCAVKISQVIISNNAGIPISEAIIYTWGVNDWAMLELGVSYYLTNRGMEKYSGSHQ